MRGLRCFCEVGGTGLVLVTSVVSCSAQQQQQQAPYYGSQTVYGGPGHAQPNVIPLNQPQQQQRIPGQVYTVRVQPCGEFGKPPCGTVVTIPAGATGESLFALAKTSSAAGRLWEAIIYVDEAATMGYMPAEAALGEDFLEGRGTQQNLVKARYWLTLAADQGDAGSGAAVGEMYERAQGGPPDATKAVHYYELAAAQHSSRAERSLGFDYELGYGVAHDRAKAIALLRRAGADGWSDAVLFANALSRTKVAQFRSEGELDALVYPPPPPGARGNVPAGCPAVLNYPAGDLGGMRKAQFCLYHPGCPVQIQGVEQMCFKPLGPTMYQILHDD
jgi:TPR repeat protein